MIAYTSPDIKHSIISVPALEPFGFYTDTRKGLMFANESNPNAEGTLILERATCVNGGIMCYGYGGYKTAQMPGKETNINMLVSPVEITNDCTLVQQMWTNRPEEQMIKVLDYAPNPISHYVGQNLVIHF